MLPSAVIPERCEADSAGSERNWVIVEPLPSRLGMEHPGGPPEKMQDASLPRRLHRRLGSVLLSGRRLLVCRLQAIRGCLPIRPTCLQAG